MNSFGAATFAELKDYLRAKTPAGMRATVNGDGGELTIEIESDRGSTSKRFHHSMNIGDTANLLPYKSFIDREFDRARNAG